MNGDYVIIGRVKAKSDTDVGFDEPICCDLDESEKELIAGCINANFSLNLDKTDMKIWVLSHYR